MATDHTTTNCAFAGKAILASDVRSLAAGHPDCILVWRARWQGAFYGGDTVREFPAIWGAREIMRQIKNERADRRATGARILNEMLTCAD